MQNFCLKFPLEQVTKRPAVKFYSCDGLFSGDWNRKAFDLIVSNPPYIERGEAVHHHALRHGPSEALFVPGMPGKDYEKWFDHYLLTIRKSLGVEGESIIEISPSKTDLLLKLASRYFKDCHIEKDLAARNRYLHLKVS